MSQLNIVKHKTIKERNKLVMSHIFLIPEVMKRIPLKLPTSIDRKDVYSIGALGLIESANRYNPHSGYLFSSFAKKRIKGAIYDELRRQNLGGQTMCKKIKTLEKTIAFLEYKHNRCASDIEIANCLGYSLKKLHKLYQDIAQSFILSLDTIVEHDDVLILPKKDYTSDVEETQLKKEKKKYLIQHIKQLTQKEQIIIQLYYYQHLSFKEISHILEVSETRISQIHTRIILKLRSRLKQ